MKPPTKPIIVTVVVRAIELTVTGSHSPDEPQTREHPGCGSSFEIETITVNDTTADITDLLTDKVMDEIASAACEAYEEQAADDWADQLDRYNEERLEP